MVGGILVIFALALGFTPVSTPTGRSCGISFGPHLSQDLDLLLGEQPEGTFTRCEKTRLARQGLTLSLGIPGAVVFVVGLAGLGGAGGVSSLVRPGSAVRARS